MNYERTKERGKLNFEWQWKKFGELSQYELYALLKLRQEIFVVEQKCIYQDLDNLDQDAWHLLAHSKSGSDASNLAAYLRVIMPGDIENVTMGRVVVSHSYRGTGLGRDLVKKGIQFIESALTKPEIRISAQAYLTGFYEDLGFSRCSKPYDEDGILHVEMIRTSEVSG